MQQLGEIDSGAGIASSSMQIPKPHKKAPWACLQCRGRKVRCDVSQTGRPCTRCRRNGEACLEHPSDQRATLRRRRKEVATEHAECIACPLPAPKAVQPLIPDPQPSGDTQVASSQDEATSSNPSSPPRLVEPSSTSIFYLNYQFLSVGNLQHLLSEDIDYLELQGCFLIPRREILDDIVQHYFLHVHPLLPLFNEADFWQMYSHQGPPVSSSSKMSLLVFQALMFASCNFTSASTIKALGFPDFRQAKASFYRKAKLLFDFESESSPISLSQAALLLSWRPSYATPSAKRPSTTWLTLAIQNAEIAEANHYESFQPSSSPPADTESKHQNTLKRLWWCCIIRDRVLPLCVRRNIQIDRARFNFAANEPLGYADLESEIEHSRVYNPKSKRCLLRILEKFIELCIILTDILGLVYPLGERRSAGYTSISDPSKVWRAKNALREWEKGAALRLQNLINTTVESLDSSEGIPHPSVTLYIDLINMYYHSSWLALCHHEALGLTNETGQVYNSLDDVSSATQQNQRELHTAASAVTECLERLNRLRLDRWLPSSAVACTATPLVLNILDVKLSILGSSANSPESGSRFSQKHERLKVLIDAMKTYHPQYDGVDFVVNAVRHIVDLVQLEGLQPMSGSATSDSFEWTDILTMNPSLYLRLALTIDLSLSKDRLAQELDFPPSLRGLFEGNFSPIRVLLAQGRGSWHNTMDRRLSTSFGPELSITPPGMEEWLRWSQRLSLTPSYSQAGHVVKNHGFVTEVDGEAEGLSVATGDQGKADEGIVNIDDTIVLDIPHDQAFDIQDFMGEVVGTLTELETSTFVDDMIRAAMI